MSFKSQVDDFLKDYSKKRDDAIKQIAKKGEDNIKAETPVDTGELKANNSSATIDTTIIFYNKKDYAPHVELGTYKQRANPFMRRGINKTKSDIIDIFKRELKV